jgi:hypothetical protein
MGFVSMLYFFVPLYQYKKIPRMIFHFVVHHTTLFLLAPPEIRPRKKFFRHHLEMDDVNTASQPIEASGTQG